MTWVCSSAGGATHVSITAALWSHKCVLPSEVHLPLDFGGTISVCHITSHYKTEGQEAVSQQPSHCHHSFPSATLQLLHVASKGQQGFCVFLSPVPCCIIMAVEYIH